jgi:hypothetical protein
LIRNSVQQEEVEEEVHVFFFFYLFAGFHWDILEESVVVAV